MFWFCDPSCDGSTFEQRHMLCKDNRHFDGTTNQCVSPPEELPDHPANQPEFTCAGRTTGKYPDAADCLKYYMCLPENPAHSGHPAFNQIVLVCPEGTAFDAQREVCNVAAREDCDENSSDEEYDEQDEDDSNGEQDACEPGYRAMDADQENCVGYTVCVGKATIPMRCPRHHRFDESSRRCRPEAMVKC